MIRAFEPSDMEDVLELWLEASAEAPGGFEGDSHHCPPSGHSGCA
jgi:hypothetical protein